MLGLSLGTVLASALPSKALALALLTSLAKGQEY